MDPNITIGAALLANAVRGIGASDGTAASGSNLAAVISAASRATSMTNVTPSGMASLPSTAALVTSSFPPLNGQQYIIDMTYNAQPTTAGFIFPPGAPSASQCFLTTQPYACWVSSNQRAGMMPPINYVAAPMNPNSIGAALGFATNTTNAVRYATRMDLDRHAVQSSSVASPSTLNSGPMSTAPPAREEFREEPEESAQTSRQTIVNSTWRNTRQERQRSRPHNEQTSTSQPEYSLRRRHVQSSMGAYQQLKDTVARAQERKRARERGEQAADGAASSSVASSSTYVNGASASSSSESSRPPKLRRQGSSRNVQTIQSENVPPPPAERPAPSTASAYNDQHLCNSSSAASSGSQLGAFPVSAGDNCHYCSANRAHNSMFAGQVNAPRVPDGLVHNGQDPNHSQCPPNVRSNADEMASIMNLLLEARPPQQPAVPQAHPLYQNSTLGLTLPTTPATSAVLSATQSQIRYVQEAFLAQQVSQLQQIPRLIPGNLYVLPQQFQSRMLDMSILVNVINPGDVVTGERSVLERHHMFNGHTTEPQPIGVTVQDIEKCTEKLQFVKDKELPEEETERCTVCLCDFETGEEVRTLRCTHIFHPTCIDKWLVYNKKCPVCRLDVDKPVIVEVAASLASVV